MSTPLQIPIIYGVDAAHGHGNVHGATIFPQNIGLGATRNPRLVERSTTPPPPKSAGELPGRSERLGQDTRDRICFVARIVLGNSAQRTQAVCSAHRPESQSSYSPVGCR